MSRDVLFSAAGYSIRVLEAKDGPTVQALCERCADYFELVTGLPPGPAEAQSLFIELPEGKGYEDKLLMGIFASSGDLVGVLAVIGDYPFQIAP